MHCIYSKNPEPLVGWDGQMYNVLILRYHKKLREVSVGLVTYGVGMCTYSYERLTDMKMILLYLCHSVCAVYTHVGR